MENKTEISKCALFNPDTGVRCDGAVSVEENLHGDDSGIYNVWCEECDYKGPIARSEAKAVMAHNWLMYFIDNASIL